MVIRFLANLSRKHDVHMIIKPKFSFIGSFILALVAFSNGLSSIAYSMTYSGIEHDFIADNWISPLILLLTIVFALGWWVGNFDEYLFLNDRRKLAIFTFLSILIVYGVVSISSILTSGFISLMLKASADMVVSGFLFRLSVINLEVLGRLWVRN